MTWITREEARVDKYQLADRALEALAEIVRGADTDARRLTPESAGLYAAASGFRLIAKDDHDDALYASCRSTTSA